MGTEAAVGETCEPVTAFSQPKDPAGSSSKLEVLTAHGYVWVQQLGCGQYGTAHLVHKEGVKQPVVAKVVFLDHLKDRDRALALQEVEILKRLRHPNIVRHHESWLHHCSAGIEGQEALASVMEYCAGGDLRVWLEASSKSGGYLAEEVVLSLFSQMLEGLLYIHQQHILHRDLKTSNMLLDGDRQTVKIGDFGIARVLENPTAVAITMLGTPYYMSPEVCKGESYRDKSDMWSLGCVLYEMCVLRHAFESQSLLGLVYCIVSECFEPIPKERYSSALSELVGWLLKKSAEDRPSADEALRCDVLQPYITRVVTRVPVSVTADVAPAPSPMPCSTTARASTQAAGSPAKPRAEAKADQSMSSPILRPARRNSGHGPSPPLEPRPTFTTFYGPLPPVEPRSVTQAANAGSASQELGVVPLQTSNSLPALPPLRRPVPPAAHRSGSVEGRSGNTGGGRAAKTMSGWRPERTTERFASPSKGLTAAAAATAFGMPATAATSSTAPAAPKSRPTSRPRTTSTTGGSPSVAAPGVDMTYTSQVLLSRVRSSLLRRPRGRSNWVQAFALHDVTGRGMLGSAEFMSFLESLSLGLTRHEVCALSEHLTGDKGSISLGGFNEAVMHTPTSDASFDEPLARQAANMALSPSGLQGAGLSSVAA